ncbi:Mitochondrial matrix cochaperone [Mortierella sp. 14UC]|nr:Mitochondrial matrix cochaperone [Mortierella sp. 14UC]
MTRYTKLERKRHVDSGEAFAVTPLMPAKQVQSSAPAPAPAAAAPTPKPQGENNKKRKAEDSSSPGAPKEKSTEGGEGTAAAAAGPGPAKKKNKNNSKKKKAAGDKDGKPGAPQQDLKSAKSERRRLRRQKERGNASVCFACRKTGHSAKNCKESTGVGMCYSCGSLEHTTKDCKKLSKDGNKFKFATCFVCKEQGHLAGACPKNEKGLYPKGGSCRFCNKVDHLAKDCTLTKEEVGTVTLGKIDLVQGADDDDFHIFVDEKRRLTEEQKTIKKMVKTPAKPVKKGSALKSVRVSSAITSRPAATSIWSQRFYSTENKDNDKDNKEAPAAGQEAPAAAAAAAAGEAGAEAEQKHAAHEEALAAKDKQLAEVKDRLLRTLADMENLRQRTAKEVANTKDYAIQKFAKDLLDTADILNMAIKNVPQDEIAETSTNKHLKSLHTGVSMTRDELLKTFKRYGVESFDPMNEKFDPNLHQANFQVPMPGKEPGTVFDVQKIGFMIKGRILRPAQVGVVQSTD